ncbi:MAG: hypothetical protein HY909_12340 [Deltaproteobacteria bacterium]|nr:hypothetical protein [Deltaproteobacteria bacterium]
MRSTEKSLDLSQPWFSPGAIPQAAEFLQAVPMVKGAFVQVVVGKPTVNIPTLLRVSRVNAATTAQSFVYTDLSTALAEGPSEQLNALDFPMMRLGFRVDALQIDSLVASAASKNPSEWRVQGGATRLLSQLDTALGRGEITSGFLGLDGLAVTLGTPAGGWDDYAIRLMQEVVASSRGAGEGAHCFLGNRDARRSLSLTPTARNNGSCGMRMDPRSGLVVYHFLGLPFYLVDTETVPPVPPEVDPTTSLYAAHLGPSGLQLIHGYGSFDTLGIQINEEPTISAKGARGFAVHGAWALGLGEPGALVRYTSLIVTP